MAFKMSFNMVVYVSLLAWIIKCDEMTMEEDLKENFDCTDTVPDCKHYDMGRVCERNRAFTLIACRKYCGFCNECIVPSTEPQSGKLILSWDKSNSHFQLNYKCDEGYYISHGNLTRTCNRRRDKGEWSGSMPVCSPVLGRTCIVHETCENLLPGSTCNNIKCSCSSNYSQFQQKCFKDCGDVSLPVVRTSGIDNKYGSVAEFHCTEGYYNTNQIKGLSKVTCSATGDWTYKPTCMRKDCGSISSLNLHNVDTRVRLDNDTRYNSTAKVNCIEGYYNTKQNQTAGISTTIMKCSSNGTWTNMPVCERKDCGPLEHLDIQNHDLLLVFGETKVGVSATVTCKDGYYDNRKTNQPKGTSSTLISCSTNGTWTNLPNCTRKDCGDVKNIAMANAANRRVHNDTKYSSIADIDCDEGYYVQGQSQVAGISTKIITCSRTGQWVNIPICIPKDCGPLEDLNVPNHDLLLLFSDTKVGGIGTITCKVGYYDNRKNEQPESTSSTLISCSVNGTWSNVPNCTRKDCGNVYNNTIDHAANRRVYNDTKYTSTADIDCDEGYYILGQTQTTGISTKTITCSKRGKWMDLPTCIPKDCGKLENINMLNADKRLEINGTLYTSMANVNCNVGYKDESKIQRAGIDSKLIRCNENGSWKNLPKCIRKDCGPVKYLNLSNISTVHLHNDTKYGSTADVSCEEGYYDMNQAQTTQLSTKRIRCSEAGYWVDLPLCVRKDCGSLNSLIIINAKNRTLNNDTKFNSTATIRCDNGYTKAGEEQTEGLSSTEIRCNLTGEWSNIPTCIKKDCGNVGNLNISHAHTRRQYNGTKYGSTAEIECDGGYYVWNQYNLELTNISTIACSDRGEWQNIPTCVPRKIGIKMSPMCFSCDGMSSPEYCDRVEHCQQNQICYTESYQSDYGKVFRSGCMDTQKCQQEENRTVGSVCVQCCTADMCNNKGCGNTDFPSREHRGPMCFDCQHIGDTNTCRKVTMCSSDQVCSIEKQQWGDSFHYKLGCTHHLCNSLSHETFSSVPSCHACCKEDYCNRNCTSSNSVPGEIFVG